MKKRLAIAVAVVLAAVGLTTTAVWGVTGQNTLKRGNPNHSDHSEKIGMAYVIDRLPDLPDPDMFSHLIYSFGVFNDTQDSVVIRYPEKLKALADLKKKNPKLKVILGINDYRKPGFCEMAGDKKKRKSFVNSVKEVVNKYNLDGVDLDWEFPTTSAGGHTSSPQDDKNYVKLVKDLRKALGKKAWISYFSDWTGRWIDHRGMLPYITYVNVAGYNLAYPKEGERLYHQSALYSSEKTGQNCVSKAIERHMDIGIPKEKLLMGIPFYGKGLPPFPNETDWKNIHKYSKGLTEKWDEDAQAPYLCDDKGNMVLGYDDERSIAAKFEFIRTNELPGVFVWCYESETDPHPLGEAIGRLRKSEE